MKSYPCKAAPWRCLPSSFLCWCFYLCRSAIRAARPGRCDGGKRGITGYHTGAVRHRYGGGALP